MRKEFGSRVERGKNVLSARATAKFGLRARRAVAGEERAVRHDKMMGDVERKTFCLIESASTFPVGCERNVRHCVETTDAFRHAREAFGEEFPERFQVPERAAEFYVVNGVFHPRHVERQERVRAIEAHARVTGEVTQPQGHALTAVTAQPNILDTAGGAAFRKQEVEECGA